MSKEKGFGRDKSIPSIHHVSGISCSDVDMELYDYRNIYDVVARLEYKHPGIIKWENAVDNGTVIRYGVLDLLSKEISTQLKRHSTTSTALKIPFYVVLNMHYGFDNDILNSCEYPTTEETSKILAVIKHKQYFVVAYNDIAKYGWSGDRYMTEQEYWDMLYRLTNTPLCDAPDFQKSLFQPHRIEVLKP